MVPTTEEPNKSMEEVSTFYDRLAPDYDAMTGFDQRFVREKPFFQLLVEQHGIKTAIDAGAGTGFHSLLLAQMGVEVTAVDVSTEMLARLRKHASAMALHIRTVRSSFQELGTTLTDQYDAIFCTGNSLVHLLTAEDLRTSVGNFARVVRPGGIAFIQILNYERIIANRDNIQSIREQGGTTYVRYYEYAENVIRFSIMKIKTDDKGVREDVNTITLRQILRPELIKLLGENGFTDIKQYGAISMEEFVPDASKDLVILAIRG